MSEEINVKGYKVLKNLLYTTQDEWIKILGDTAIIGVTDYAQKKLKNIISVELPEPGRKVSRGEVIATIESIKTIADVYAPLSGEVIEINEALKQEPEKVNHDPYGEGWLIKIRIESKEEISSLIKPEDYARKIMESE
ncbi:MAG: glycine cleavage system protein GcvH [Sulfolobales archaeon]